MGGHSEAELQGVASAGSETEAGADDAQIEALRASAAGIVREVQGLVEKVGALAASVEALRPAAPVSAPPKVSVKPEPGPAPAEVTDSQAMTVTVAPLPELAMAAVAETTLRSLPGVRQVTAVKREGDWASFTLDVAPGTDLVAEMRSSMPVSFNVEESSPEAISFSLDWGWGAS